ncbi:chain-length determining protein [Brevundimonas sp. AAP58]|nr:chain-length determining protein [Brevundimonas sp. AAP58]
MTPPNLSFLGPIAKSLADLRPALPWWKRVSWPPMIVVVLPTLMAAIYFLMIATPRYVSEAHFIIRSAEQGQLSPMNSALQGVGLAMAPADAYAVHSYMESRDAFEALNRRFNLREWLGAERADVFSRYPRPWESSSGEAFYEAFQRYTVVGYDSTTGISTLRVEAFRPREAQAIALALLSGSEELVNRLNERSSRDAVAEALISRERAIERLAEAQAALTEFRNRERFIDPEITARESSQLLGGLLSTLAQLRAERAQLAQEAPNSPQLPIIDSRIQAYEAQIARERAAISGSSDSLAPKIGAYERLTLERELADRELAAASAALTNAEQEARRQKLYLERVVAPNVPDAPTEPSRLLSVLVVLISSLVVYGIGWFIWAGARDHWQE